METSALICSFPRSRTLWLSHFLTVPGVSKAEHEATEMAGSSGEFWERAEFLYDEPCYINVDSAQILLLPALLAKRPMTKVIWVERPLKEVINSLSKAGFDYNLDALELLALCRDKYVDLFDAIVDYRELGRLATIQAVWNMVMGDMPFDYGRWGILERKHIAYTGKEYKEQGHDMTRFWNFFKNEGELQCLS